jgi:hypothetical protein
VQDAAEILGAQVLLKRKSRQFSGRRGRAAKTNSWVKSR